MIHTPQYMDSRAEAISKNSFEFARSLERRGLDVTHVIRGSGEPETVSERSDRYGSIRGSTSAVIRTADSAVRNADHAHVFMLGTISSAALLLFRLRGRAIRTGLIHIAQPAADRSTLMEWIRQPRLMFSPMLLRHLLLNSIVFARVLKNLLTATGPTVSIATSSMTIRAQLERHGIASRVVRNGTGRTAAEISRCPEGARGRTCIAYVGHPRVVKGFDLLPGAAERLRHAGADIHWHLALTDFGSRRLSRLERFGDADVVGQTNVSALLRAVDWIVLPYRTALGTTHIPNLLVESAASGCPAIVADLDVARELLGDAAVYITPGSRQSLVDALRRVSSDPQLYRMTRDALQGVCDSVPSVEDFTDQLLASLP